MASNTRIAMAMPLALHGFYICKRIMTAFPATVQVGDTVIFDVGERQAVVTIDAKRQAPWAFFDARNASNALTPTA